MTKYIAKPYVAADPSVETLGQTTTSFLSNLKAEEYQPYLKKWGLTEIKPDVWYPQQQMLNVLKDVSENMNGMENIVAIGIQTMTTAVLPPGINTLMDALHLLTQIYHLNNRNFPDGEGATMRINGPKNLLVIHNTPYPRDFFYGFLWGLTRRFLPTGSRFTVAIIPNPVPEDEPGDAFKITWE